MKWITVILFFLTALVSANAAVAQAPKEKGKEFIVSGVMRHSDLEGGCWYLQSKDSKYELTASPALLGSCYIEGRTLKLRVIPRPFMASKCMLGRIVEVLEILDTLPHPKDPYFVRIQIDGWVHITYSGCWFVQTVDHTRYELQGQIPSKYRHVRARFDRLSNVMIGGQPKCGDMVGIITFDSTVDSPEK